MSRQPPQTPPLFKATPASVLSDTERLIEASRQVHDRIAATVSPETASFDNVIAPLAHIENARIWGACIPVFYNSVSTDPALRKASQQAQALVDAFRVETFMRDDLFALIDAVVINSGNDKSIDAESRHLLAKLHQDYARSGLKLPPGPARDRFRDIKKRIQQLAAEFTKNVTEADEVVWLVRLELEGVPDGILSQLAKGEADNEGKLGLRLAADSVAKAAALQSARNAETRRLVEFADSTRCPENVPLFRELVILRDEAARLLGYPCHAAFQLQEKMAKAPERVNEFLSDLQARLAAAGQKQIRQLKDLKKEEAESNGGLFDGQFYSWDFTYFDGLLGERSKPRGRAMVKEYFPLPHITPAMLKIYEHLFGLRFVEILGEERDKLSPSGNGADIVWHEDVQVYTVWDTDDDNAFLGYLYFDLYARDAKYGNPVSCNIAPGFTREDGTRHYPATAVLCSFPRPTADKPSLVCHFLVVLLFHELGHGIHDLVSKTRYARFHGPGGTPVDFGEIPSQVIENWCWIPEQLKAMSKHYSYLSEDYLAAWKAQNEGQPQPPEQLPDDLIVRIVEPDRPKHNALHYLRQLSMCVFDMAVHQPSSHAEITELDIPATWDMLRRSVCQFDDQAAVGHAKHAGHGYTTFQHLVQDDYSAGYYSYLFSNLFSADIFHSVFKADPMNAQEGRRYRYAVLEKGGSQDCMEIMSDFLGRAPSPEPFYKELGCN